MLATLSFAWNDTKLNFLPVVRVSNTLHYNFNNRSHLQFILLYTKQYLKKKPSTLLKIINLENKTNYGKILAKYIAENQLSISTYKYFSFLLYITFINNEERSNTVLLNKQAFKQTYSR